jgi:hypothetical protein
MFVITPSFNYSSVWIRRPLDKSELFTAFDIPHYTQVILDLDSLRLVLATLPSSTPVGVFRMLITYVLPKARACVDCGYQVFVGFK